MFVYILSMFCKYIIKISLICLVSWAQQQLDSLEHKQTSPTKSFKAEKATLAVFTSKLKEIGNRYAGN